MNRRTFLKTSSVMTAGAGLLGIENFTTCAADRAGSTPHADKLGWRWLAPSDEVKPQAADAKPERPAINELLGRVEVPRLRLASSVREGTDDDVLRIAAGHMPSWNGLERVLRR